MATIRDTLIFEFKVDDQAAKVFDAWEKRLADLEKQYSKSMSSMANETTAAVQAIQTRLEKLGGGGWGKIFDSFVSVGKAAFDGLLDVAVNVFKSIWDAGKAALSGLKDAFIGIARESISLEDAMNGVKRTGGLTTEQIAQLTNKVRDYSVETLKGFVSSEELAKALEIAGQAGIISGDNFEQTADSALKFAGVLTQAAVALDGMSLEESGERLGRFHMTFSETVDDIDRAASVLNYFGNITNRSAGFILNLSGRFAENAKMLRLSEGETMAVAAALGNLNIESEKSGTAIGRAMKVMRSESAAFAEAFQMDVGKFTELIRTDAPAAIQMFADQMNKLGQTNEGVDVVLQALEDLELTGDGVSTVLLGLGGQADNLRQYLADQGREWANNTSLMNEFINSTDRTSQLWQALQIIWSNTTGLIGDQLLPVFRSFLLNVNEQAAAFRQWFKDSGFVETVLAPALAEINRLLFDGVQGVASYVREWAKTVDIDAVMARIKEKFFALIEALKNIDWAQKFEQVKTALVGIWETIKNIDWANMISAASEIAQFVTQFVQSASEARDTWAAVGQVFSGIADAVGTLFDKIRAISFPFFEMITDKIFGVEKSLTDSLPAAVKEAAGAVIDLVGGMIKGAFETIGDAAVGLMEGLASKITGFFSSTKAGSEEAVKGVQRLTEATNQNAAAVRVAEQETTGNSWLPDLVSWTDRARNDVMGLTAAITQSASASAQASSQIAAQAQQAIAAMNEQGDYIARNYQTGQVSQGAADVFDARQRIAQSMLPAGQVLYEDGSIGTKPAASPVAPPLKQPSSFYGSGKSGIQQIAPGVYSNIAREVGKESAVSISKDFRSGASGAPMISIVNNGINAIDPSSQTRLVNQISRTQSNIAARTV